MIYVPNPKDLVYGELYFISTVASVKAPEICFDAIIDEVSHEVYSLFIGAPVVDVVEAAPAWQYTPLAN